MTGDGEFAYGWDAENRLISITPPSPYSQDDVKLTFDYDYMGRRVVKKVWTYDAQSPGWEVTQDLRFVYDGWNVVMVPMPTLTPAGSLWKGPIGAR